VLKLLQKSYHNRIKMIYIDPPYNTGNDFVYKDNFRDNIKNYMKVTGQVDEAGNKLTTNSNQNGRYHSNWLNMMYPRLKLARNLLEHNGAIFISIDENEIHNLRKLCDEIFGPDNFLTQIGIKLRHEKRILKGDKDFHEVYEYCLIYKKSNSYRQTKRIEDNTSIDKYIYTVETFGEPEEHLILDGKKVEVFSPSSYKLIKHEVPKNEFFQNISIRGSLKEGNSSGRFYMKHLEGMKEKYSYLYKVPDMGNDRFDFRYFMRPVNETRLNGSYFQGVPIDKKETKEVPYPNFYDYVDVFNNVGYEGGVVFRNGKKPLTFLNQMLTLGGVQKESNSIILDFFSGSSSTAHAVMNLNLNDNGNRKFIMVQIPEATNQTSEAYKAGYKNICEIGKERIRRAGEKIKEELTIDNVQLKMVEEKKDIKNLDIGFKVFKLDSSNIKEWDSEYAKDNITQSLFDHVDNIKSDRTEEDILFELLLKHGLDLTTPIDEIEIDGKKIFNIGAGTLYICLANGVDIAIAESILEEHKNLESPRVSIIFKDTGFINDIEKTNVIQTLKVAGITDVKSV
jgi:adenine-specific DNA-methyltransferase